MERIGSEESVLSGNNKSLLLQMKLARSMAEIKKWWWLSLFLFFLVFPIVMLVINLLEFKRILEYMYRIEPNEKLEKAIELFTIGIILSFIPMIDIAGWICLIISFGKLKDWADERNARVPNGIDESFSEAFDTIRLGIIFSPLIIGLFIIPVGFAKGADVMRYFQNPDGSYERIEYRAEMPEPDGEKTAVAPGIDNQIGPGMSSREDTPATLMPNGYISGESRTIPPNNSNDYGSAEEGFTEKRDVRYCPNCGTRITDREAKYCPVCGMALF